METFYFNITQSCSTHSYPINKIKKSLSVWKAIFLFFRRSSPAGHLDKHSHDYCSERNHTRCNYKH